MKAPHVGLMAARAPAALCSGSALAAAGDLAPMFDAGCERRRAI